MVEESTGSGDRAVGRLVDVRLTAEILSELGKGYKILERLIKRKRTSKWLKVPEWECC